MPSLVRHSDFMKLWTGETISQLGSQVSLLALPLVAIKTLHATTLQVGFLSAVEFSPFILVGLVAGAIVDRLPRRPVLMIGDLGRAVALLSIPVAYWLDWLSLAQLFVVVFSTGILTVFFDVAYQAYLPALVDRSQLADGNTKLEISRSGASIAGPGLGGLLVQWLRAPVAVFVDAASFVASAAAVFVIRKREPVIERPPRHERVGLRAEIGEGLRYVLGDRYLRNIAGCTATSNYFSSMATAVFLLYAVRRLGYSAGAVGLVFAVGNIGFLAGAALCGPITRWLRLGPAIYWSILVSGIGWLFVAGAPHSWSEPWFFAGFMLMSLGSPIYNINQVSFRQTVTPHRMQGRMNATMRFIVWGTMPLGSVSGGILGSVLGLQTTLWIGAVGGLLAIFWVYFTPVRTLRDMPEPVDDDEPYAASASDSDPDSVSEPAPA